MQFSRALRALPVVLGFASVLAAQTRQRVISDGEGFHQEPGGKQLARLARGAVVTGGATRGDWMQVTIEGWIFAASVGPTSRDGFDLVVTRAPDENIRSAPAGALVGKLAEGFLLDRVGGDDRWVRVKRDGWVKRAALEPLPVAEAGSPAADSAPGASTGGPRAGDTLPPAPVDPARARAARQTTLFRAPDGPAAGTVSADAPLRVLSRSGEWTRVQLEAWVKSSDLQAAPPGVLVGVTAAELRADPERYRGQVLRWTLQFISVQEADELRPDVPRGATYLLARGPLPERGFVYVVVPEARRGELASLTPLASIQITARVRVGRSRFLGHPVVDLIMLETLP